MNNASPKNKEMFEEFRALDLPLGEYFIASSGVLAIRGIREANDVDVIVSDELWEKLKDKYEVLVEGGFEKMRPSPNVEILWDGTFDQVNEGKKIGPSIKEQIEKAEVIDGLAFQSLEHCLWFKTHMGREKDKKDIELINEYLINNK